MNHASTDCDKRGIVKGRPLRVNSPPEPADWVQADLTAEAFAAVRGNSAGFDFGFDFHDRSPKK